MPGFNIALPAENINAEVQVQRKNEEDLGRFFIDADDGLVSPMITRNQDEANRRSGTFTAPSGGMSAAAVIQAKKAEAAAGSYAAALATSTAVPPSSTPRSASMMLMAPGRAPPPHSGISGGAAPASSQGDKAKFFHLDKTNLFVLLNGVSMFYQGRSTFTGKEDPHLIQSLLTKRQEKKDQRARDRELGLMTTGGSSAHPTFGSPVDSVARAIYHFEAEESSVEMPCFGIAIAIAADAAANSTSATSPVSSPSPGWAPAGNGAAAPSLTPITPLSVTPPPPTKVPEQFASLFAHNPRPVGTPLFGHGRAIAPAVRTAAPLTPPVMSSVSSPTSISSPRPSGRLTAAPPCSLLVPPVPGGLSDADMRLANSSFSSQDSSTRAFHIRRDASSMSLNTLDGRVPGTPVSEMGCMPASERPMCPKKPKVKPVTVADIGQSNHSLEIDDVEFTKQIGSGTQGKVYQVRLDGRYYALKCLDVKEAIEATSQVERQGRKQGLIKELKMILAQRDHPLPKYLMQMFNAVVTADEDTQLLNLLIELMSFGVEDAQQMLARIPQEEMISLAQSVFREFFPGNPNTNTPAKELLKSQHGSCIHVLGRGSHLNPQNWERHVERQTTMPEIVLSMLAHDVLKGLNELHEHYHLLHCDLKPANVLLCFDKQKFKIADFGCSSAMDEDTRRVSLTGADLGSMLYKAPERLTSALGGSNNDSFSGSFPGARDTASDFSAKADVWSLGIMLLELGGGVHPCAGFKSDFWNYINKLKLSQMTKPVAWSPAFCDFIVRCVAVEEDNRWAVNELLKHPFITKYAHVPRSRLRIFMERLERISATYQRNQQKKTLREQIKLSTARKARDTYHRDSIAKWNAFNQPLRAAPNLRDPKMFPSLV